MASVLEKILKASSSEDRKFDTEYPIVLNAYDSMMKLYPKFNNLEPNVLATPLLGWEFSTSNLEQIDLSKKFIAKLTRMLKDTKGFGKEELLETLLSFLSSFREKFGIYVGHYDPDEAVSVLVQKVAPAAGRDVVGLILKACSELEIWNVIETMIVSEIVDHSYYPTLLKKALSKQQARLVCLAIKHAPDFFHSDLLSILRCFLCPTKDFLPSMLEVLKEWESQALLAMETTKSISVQSNTGSNAKDASILLMVAYDGFSRSEMCLHYLLSSANVDDVALSSCFGKLSGKEMMKLVKYLGKWLKKYEKFPQAMPCGNAATSFGLTLCDCVPKLEDVIRWLGLLYDECFTSIVLNSDFHEELKGMKRVVHSMAVEAKDCCFVSHVIDQFETRENKLNFNY